MSISEVVMPQMGADMKEGTILRWLKSEGQPVNRGEPIAEIETDKANVEIEAFGAGTFRKALSAEGAVVPVGTVIAVIAAPEDDISSYEAAAAAPATSTAAPAAPEAQAPGTPENPQPAETQAPAALATPAAPSTPATPAAPSRAPAASASGERLRVSPVARRRAEELGLDLSTLTGSGPDGRILLSDVESAATATPAPAAPTAAPSATPSTTSAAAPPMRMATPSGEDVVEDVPLTRIRQTIARRMQQSKQEAPHYYLQVDVDMTDAQAFRTQANAALGDAGARITVNDLIVMSCARALVQHPNFNAWWVEDHLQTHSQVNIGIAVPLDDGLVVPCLLDTANKGLAQLAFEARDLAERARANHLRPEEYGSPTFSVSNLGGPQFGIDVLTAIINPPQVGVLGVGSVVEKPVVRDGQIVIRSIMSVVLAADHRASDGADGARFLQSIKRNLETPALMLL